VEVEVEGDAVVGREAAVRGGEGQAVDRLLRHVLPQAANRVEAASVGEVVTSVSPA
jgi:hypothetical protein